VSIGLSEASSITCNFKLCLDFRTLANSLWHHTFIEEGEIERPRLNPEIPTVLRLLAKDENDMSTQLWGRLVAPVRIFDFAGFFCKAIFAFHGN
jgi:hypothetical protein